MENEVKDIVYTLIGHALHATDSNHVVAVAKEIYDEEFVLSGKTGYRQSDINKYLLEHGGGGGGSVDPEQVKVIIFEYLNENGYLDSGDTFEIVSIMIDEALKNVVANIVSPDESIKVVQDTENKQTLVTINHFDGGVITI